MAVVVGDVTGHGVAAAADMALIRGMITALLHAGVSRRRVQGGLGGRHSTLRPTPRYRGARRRRRCRETFTFATAGHPPPLLLLSDGQVRMLATANGPIIGDTSPSVSDTVPFPWRPARHVHRWTGRARTGLRVGVEQARPTSLPFPTTTPPRISPTPCSTRSAATTPKTTSPSSWSRTSPNGPVGRRHLNSRGPETPRPRTFLPARFGGG